MHDWSSAETKPHPFPLPIATFPSICLPLITRAERLIRNATKNYTVEREGISHQQLTFQDVDLSAQLCLWERHHHQATCRQADYVSCHNSTLSMQQQLELWTLQHGHNFPSQLIGSISRSPFHSLSKERNQHKRSHFIIIPLTKSLSFPCRWGVVPQPRSQHSLRLLWCAAATF